MLDTDYRCLHSVESGYFSRGFCSVDLLSSQALGHGWNVFFYHLYSHTACTFMPNVRSFQKA
jgi:hypothetical protein